MQLKTYVRVERGVYLSAALLSFVLGFFPVPPRAIQVVYAAALLLIILFHYVFGQITGAGKSTGFGRCLQKNYIPAVAGSPVPSGQGRGRVTVLLIFGGYLLLLWLICLQKTMVLFHRPVHLANWNIFLCGVFLLLYLDHRFRFHHCLIRQWIFSRHQTASCCMDCPIAGWDDLLLFSPFAFAIFFVKLHGSLRGILIAIEAVSLVKFLVWEYCFRKYPERFSPRTNQALTCQSCPVRQVGCNRTASGK